MFSLIMISLKITAAAISEKKGGDLICSRLLETDIHK